MTKEDRFGVRFIMNDAETGNEWKLARLALKEDRRAERAENKVKALQAELRRLRRVVS